MISYFNSGYPVRYLIAFIIACIIWLPSLISPHFIFEQNSVIGFFDLNIEFIRSNSKYFIWVSFIFTALTAVAVNQILKEYDLVNINNTNGLILFVLFASVIPLYTSVNLYVLLNLILILFIQGVLKLSLIENPVSVVFNSSFFLGIASLFFSPLIFLIIIIWIALIMNMHTDIRNFIISIIGLLLPYLFVFTWFFWNDTLIENWNQIIVQLSNYHLNIQNWKLNVFDIVMLLFPLILIIFSVLKVINKLGEKSNYTRRNTLLILYFLALLMIIIILFSGSPLTLLLLALPATIIVSVALNTIERFKRLNVFFIIFVSLIILYHYTNYFNVKEILFP